MAEGNNSAGVKITGSMLLLALTALLFAWGAWVTNRLLENPCHCEQQAGNKTAQEGK